MFPNFYQDLARTHIAEREQAAQQARLIRRRAAAGGPRVLGPRWVARHLTLLLRGLVDSRGLDAAADAGSGIVPRPVGRLHPARTVDGRAGGADQGCNSGPARAMVDASC